MKKLKKGQLVEVTFADIESDPQWQSVEQRNGAKPPICTCVGHIDHQDADTLYLSSMMSGRDADLHKIPHGCISEIWALSYSGKQPLWRKLPYRIVK